MIRSMTGFGAAEGPVGGSRVSVELRSVNQFTQNSTGGNAALGYPLADFTRGFISYSYEGVVISDLNPLYRGPAFVQGNPFLADALL